jgi:hypothetical protein
MDTSTATLVGQTVHDPAVVLAFGAVLTGLLKLVSLISVGLAGRLMNTKLNVENSTWKQKLALRLVCYAEQKIAADSDKQAYVSRELSKILGGRVQPEEIQHLLEEAVVQLQALTKGVTPS